MAATASPAFHFASQSSLLKYSASASSSVTATLDSLQGVNQVTWSVASTDDTTDAGDYTLVASGPKGSVCTFTSGTAGTALILQCTVNAGVDSVTGNVSSAMTAKAKCFVPTSAGLEVGCFNEQYESGSQGWLAQHNAAVRGAASGVAATEAYVDAAIAAAIEAAMGTTVTKTITLSANNTTATVDLFTVTGPGVRISALYGVVTTALGSDHTDGQLIGNDGSDYDITATGASAFSSAGVGSTLVIAAVVSDPLSFVPSTDGFAAADVSAPIFVKTKNGVPNKIQYRYATTDAPTSGVIKWILKYTPIDDGAVAAV